MCKTKNLFKYPLILLSEIIVIMVLVWLIRDFAGINTEKVKAHTAIAAKIEKDLKKFPVPLSYISDISYEDSFGAYRSNGGHEGCDIMSVSNIPGEIPIVSAVDGTVTNKGWLYLGGYRIGITSDNGVYYYYAHLDSYAEGVDVGDVVAAGQLIGFMGDSGEGEEGTRGKFPVHLHFGIYAGINEGQERAVNPYPFLKNIENK